MFVLFIFLSTDGDFSETVVKIKTLYKTFQKPTLGNKNDCFKQNRNGAFSMCSWTTSNPSDAWSEYGNMKDIGRSFNNETKADWSLRNENDNIQTRPIVLRQNRSSAAFAIKVV